MTDAEFLALYYASHLENRPITPFHLRVGRLGSDASETPRANPDGNLSGRQVEFARTIHGAGSDLLNLISDILDLSKIESGTVSVDAEEIALRVLAESVARPFGHEAERRGLSFDVTTAPELRSIITDSKRLQQVLKNLLSNAIKFTEQGGVRMRIASVSSG